MISKTRFAIFFLALAFICTKLRAQTPDMFQNHVHETSTRVLEAEFDKSYLPVKMEFHQEWFKNESLENLNEKVRHIALESLRDEIQYNKIFGSINQKLAVLNQISASSTRNAYERPKNFVNARFEFLTIRLIGIFNDKALFSANYKFDCINSNASTESESLVERLFFSADLKTGQVEKIEVSPTQKQLEGLKEIVQQKINRLYLIHTQKMDFFEEETREKFNPKNIVPAVGEIDYSEAKVFPYASGLFVEFEEYSRASGLFNGKAFRVFFPYRDTSSLIAVFPQFKTFFGKKPIPISSTDFVLLTSEKYNLRRFQRGPETMDFIDALPTGNKIYKIKVANYQVFDNGEKTKMGTTVYRFDKKAQLELIEHRDGKKGEIIKEEKFTYYEKGKEKTHLESGRDKNLELHHYLDERPHFTEIFDEQSPNYYSQRVTGEGLRIHVSQKHFFYNDSFRYWFSIDLIGKRDRNNRILYNYITSNELCNDSFCLVLDENKDILGIKGNKSSFSGGDILFDENGNPIESHFDYNRYHHYFVYDEQNRIVQVKSYHGTNLKKEINYSYIGENIIPNRIKEKNESTIVVHDYTIEYW